MTDAATANPATGAVTDVTSAAAAFRSMGIGDALDKKPAPAATEQAESGEGASPPSPEAESPETGDSNTESTESTERAGQSDDEPLYTVTIDGKEERVPLKELLAGYQKDADYRRKTASLAEQRKATEAELQQATQERQHYRQQLEALIPMLQTQLQDKFANVDWVRLARENPSDYVSLKAEYDASAQRLQMAVAERERIAIQQKAETDKHRSRWMAEQEKRLVQLIPEWKDEQRGRKEIAEIRDYLVGEGVAKDIAAEVFDAVHLTLARKAMLYDKAQKAKDAAAEKVVNIPKVQRPGTTTKTDHKAEAVKEALSHHRKSGSVDTAAAAFRKMKIFG